MNIDGLIHHAPTYLGLKVVSSLLCMSVVAAGKHSWGPGVSKVGHVTLTGYSPGTDCCWEGSVSQMELKVQAGVAVRVQPGSYKPQVGADKTGRGLVVQILLEPLHLFLLLPLLLKKRKN